jgi:anti-sigma regulatory factor (Ser/Thr protein kinase)/anti-anti-sigma regulatory factor
MPVEARIEFQGRQRTAVGKENELAEPGEYARALLEHHSPYLLLRVRGVAPDGACAALHRAAQQATERPEALLLELSGLHELGSEGAAALTRLATAVLREGRECLLVGCAARHHALLRASGWPPGVGHHATLAAATGGRLQRDTEVVCLHLRSEAGVLRRLRAVTARLAERARATAAERFNVVLAVSEAATNAIVHGSPAGPRQQVRVTYNLGPAPPGAPRRPLVVDVADSGPGFDAWSEEEQGLGLRVIRTAADHAEFFAENPGTLVRLAFWRPGHPGCPGPPRAAPGGAGEQPWPQ